ncbi:MAG TPA: hypothetical protein VLY03_09095 [Bacteroidota bacterium]|nr:hypothetical protein [Bacteroidota bacterium]
MELQQCWEAIRGKVCSRCVDGDGYGNCRIGPGRECALQQYLSLVINAVERVRSERVQDYVTELRAIVCAQCSQQEPEGHCRVRGEVDCALDRYFPLVIEAIEEVRVQHAV